MKSKWVCIDDDTAIDIIIDEDEIAANESLEQVTNEMEYPHQEVILPVDTQLNLEFGKWQHLRFLDYFHIDLTQN